MTSPDKRLSTLMKLTTLYAYRYQVLDRLVVPDRRGPIFHFPLRTQEFVNTEIGSPYWVPPQEMQDVHLKRFGNNLPLELRQRLMDLGWTDDEAISSKSDWDRVPLPDLPTLHWQDLGTTTDPLHATHGSPMKALTHSRSTGSDHPFKSKKRRAVFAPVFMSIIVEQAVFLQAHTDDRANSASTELVKLIQRDDPASLLRPIVDQVSIDFGQAMPSLNALATTLTPGFAYAAFNTLVGYLKGTIRLGENNEHFASALMTISKLVPGVSEISLRDIRKNKAEHVLLPASIHEDEGGFKVHLPWQQGQRDVQTAQLHLLMALLKANPRDVYLVKKMLSNLQIGPFVSDLPFARAWLLLIIALFSTVNRNYNDRAELRHFLSNAAAILRWHGSHDTLVAAHAMRVFILCSARFRRLFASMGVSTIMAAIFEVYENGRSDPAIRDCIEYCWRSFYRIHQDHFVHQACVVISDNEYDAKAAYELLSSLSVKNTTASGIISGLRGLNDKEELESLVQMLSGPELSPAEVGHDASERFASKMANINLDAKSFPKEDIIRLFVTVIAANPATVKATRFVRLLTGMTPYVDDLPSRDLLKDAIEALGKIISEGKIGSEAARIAFHAGEDGNLDWTQSKREYILLVQAFAESGGTVSPAALQRTLEVAIEVLKPPSRNIGSATSTILRDLAKTNFKSTSNSSVTFLKDLAPLYRLFIDVIDFSGLLDKITELLQRPKQSIDQATRHLIVDTYLGLALQTMGKSSENNMIFVLPIRSATVSLLTASVILPGDALSALERISPNPSLLAAVIFPLCLKLSALPKADDPFSLDPTWLRILNYAIRPFRRVSRPILATFAAPSLAALSMLSLQIIKIVMLVAPKAISDVKGLWIYLGNHLQSIINGGDAGFSEGDAQDPFHDFSTPPRLVDWMMWSIFEFALLTKVPLRVELEWPIRRAIAEASKRRQVAPPSPHLEASRQSPRTTLSRFGSRSPGCQSLDVPHSQPSPRRSPDHLSTGHGPRHSLEAPSVRSASRPSFQPFNPFARAGYTKRFPSSAPIRSVERSAKGEKREAIVHLLGTPITPSAAFSPRLSASNDHSSSANEISLMDEIWGEEARRAMKICKKILGMQTRDETDYEDLDTGWTVEHAFVSSTHLFIALVNFAHAR